MQRAKGVSGVLFHQSTRMNPNLAFLCFAQLLSSFFTRKCFHRCIETDSQSCGQWAHGGVSEGAASSRRISRQTIRIQNPQRCHDGHIYRFHIQNEKIIISMHFEDRISLLGVTVHNNSNITPLRSAASQCTIYRKASDSSSIYAFTTPESWHVYPQEVGSLCSFSMCSS